MQDTGFNGLSSKGCKGLREASETMDGQECSRDATSRHAKPALSVAISPDRLHGIATR
jgi:hypothetical protein